MTTGIASSDHDLLLRLAWTLEGLFADVEDCVTEGPGPHETRPEYLRRYKQTSLRAHPDGRQHALLLSDAARSKLADLKATLAGKRVSGGASTEELAFDALPAETALDASWDTPPPPFPFTPPTTAN